MKLKGFVAAEAVCSRFDISDATLRRWVKDKEMAFPQPIRVKRKVFFNERQIDKFESRLIHEGAH